MVRRMIPLVGLALVLAGSSVLAADAAKPTGKWTRTAGDTTVLFEFKADNMLVTLTDGTNSIKVIADYTFKDGVLDGTVKKIEKQGVEGGPSEGDKFSFKVKIDKEKMTLSELKGSGTEEAKQLVEGEYKMVK